MFGQCISLQCSPGNLVTPEIGEKIHKLAENAKQKHNDKQLANYEQKLYMVHDKKRFHTFNKSFKNK